MAIANLFVVTLSAIYLTLFTTVWTERIYGGLNATTAQFPALAHIKSQEQNCSGSIIHVQWVLTAAHCLSWSSPPNKTTIVAGNADYKKAFSDSNAQIRTGKTLLHHPDYIDMDFLPLPGIHDVALIEVNQLFTFNNYVNKLEFSKDNWLSGNEGIRENCIACGWGLTNSKEWPTNLQYLNTKVKYGKGQCPCITHNYIIERTVCLPDIENEGICRGDSGGPLICDKKIVGVASALMDKRCPELVKGNLDNKTIDCGDKNGFGVYTYTCPYLRWIHDKVPGVPSSCIAVTSTYPNCKIISLLIICNFFL